MHEDIVNRRKQHVSDIPYNDLGEGTNHRYSESTTAFTTNGGIARLQRYGLQFPGTYGKVDDLTVTYSGNRISTVTDTGNAVTQNDSMDYPGGSTPLSFTYNSFGALVSDESRGISAITYDNFGNPLTIRYTGPDATANTYSATGEKLRSMHISRVMTTSDLPYPEEFIEEAVFDTADADGLNAAAPVIVQSRTEYHGNVIYGDGKPDMVLFPGGYATLDGGMTFHYYTQDYLGNNRAVINGSTGTIEQAIAYYPYGGIIPDLGNPAGGQPYRFGGKELINANGLNAYDFGAR